MAIYVDAKLAEKNIDNADFSWCTDVDNIIEACIEALQSTPQADVAPVIHAHWEEEVTNTGKLYFRCSNCSTAFSPSHGLVYKYCFYCNAKMDEEVDNGEIY